MAEILIDKDRFDFLQYAFFGGDKPFPAVSDRAYRDLCRTLRFHGESGTKYRDHVGRVLDAEITAMLSKPPDTQAGYDTWHHALCDELIGYYGSTGFEFNLGHAQKWVNMTMKYIYIHGALDITPVFGYLHVPLDSYVFGAVERELGIKPPCNAWSKISSYEQYIRYQKRIRAAVTAPPLRWEFQNWLSEAKRRNLNQD